MKENYSETILVQDTRYQHYCRQMDRLSVIDGIITRQYFDETGAVKYNQVLLPKHLVQDLLESLHGKANKHPGISKMLIEIRQNITILALQRSLKNGCKAVKLASKINELPTHQ